METLIIYSCLVSALILPLKAVHFLKSGGQIAHQFPDVCDVCGELDQTDQCLSKLVTTFFCQGSQNTLGHFGKKRFLEGLQNIVLH